MAILDSKGRLFGKVSILDLGAATVILLVIVGIFFFPGTSGSVAQIGVTTKPVEVDVIALGMRGRNPQDFLKAGEKTNLIIRNQPYGQVDIKAVEFLPRTIPVTQPDGSLRALPDPTADFIFSNNILLTLEGQGQVTNTGPVLGNVKIRIGNTVELEGNTYNFNASVVDIRVQD
ncbi:MAG: DUF4330 domain-containing protein [Limnospira sp. PMC 1291.21]|uniref:Pyruvate/2-oxoglutarate dehydrogenase complex,dihydrolipoamide dehydrogenase (E3) component n=3 Tax=Limnospira TaxID=2596745 RepID=A0A9P1KBM7_9CYAN|nr:MULTISPECIES: DUF4330 domain-containing protein [Limnospira]EKD10527.1 hypothetical protein SPLC1_S082020 [Arthrospira platensis C1]MDC0840497.1 DUF4330 domain-containing protein [Limnoraphis robusta]MDY7055017.1 DUF4330 domain-containing protein [Limnospira fusiformis LS22]QJB28322.1 DUF4330 domain-containing protein [Limnospira fusiformis SAG 85.79]RAQ39139.1 DUF4330 domain-containing protein [Arthrospira sp. O9.13F]